MGKRLVTFFNSILSYFFAFLDEILSAKTSTLSPKPKNSFPSTVNKPDPVEPDPIVPEVHTDPTLSKYPVFQWPTDFPGVVTQAFGINPQWYEQWGVPAHEGIDMKAPKGTLIVAVWEGIISRVGEHVAYGNHIRVHHEINGNIYESVYAHFEKPSVWKVSDKISRGGVLGRAGSTGNSTGPHLHFMLKQFAGELPDTDAQKKYEWPFDIIDPTPFFKELDNV